MIRIGVTGTDTGVGKTVVSVAILAMLRERGLRVSAMKPVETGVARGDPRSDAARLREAAGGADPEDLVCPLVLPDPLAPWIAARRAGTEVDLDLLDRAFGELCEGRDAILVEGAGGLLVPLTRSVAFDTLFRRWSAGVILVAADRLGVVNHTRLTVMAAEAAGVEVWGVVLNAGHDPHAHPGSGEDPQEPARETNLEVLRELLPGTPVLGFPRLGEPGDLPGAAEAARAAGLDALFRDLRSEAEPGAVPDPAPAHSPNPKRR